MKGVWLVGPLVNINDAIDAGCFPMVRVDDQSVRLVFSEGPVLRPSLFRRFFAWVFG